jgi:hypothetical protein
MVKPILEGSRISAVIPSRLLPWAGTAAGLSLLARFIATHSYGKYEKQSVGGIQFALDCG